MTAEGLDGWQPKATVERSRYVWARIDASGTPAAPGRGGRRRPTPDAVSRRVGAVVARLGSDMEPAGAQGAGQRRAGTASAARTPPTQPGLRVGGASPGPSLLLPTTPAVRDGCDGAPPSPAQRPRGRLDGNAGAHGEGGAARGSWRDLAACLQLCDKMLDAVQQDAPGAQVKSVSQASDFATRSTVGLMLSHTVIEHLVVGGPAYNTGLLGKGDDITHIDGKDVHMRLLHPHKDGHARHAHPKDAHHHSRGHGHARHAHPKDGHHHSHGYEHLAAALTGSDVPGTPVTLTVKKFRTGETREVVLTRMATELIADRRRLFELFTCLKDRAILDNDTVARDCVDQVIELWTKMVQAEAAQHSQASQHLREKQSTLRSGLQAMKAKIPAVHSLVVDAQAHDKLELRVAELESALRKSCEEHCALELQHERLQARLSEHEGMLGNRELLTSSATALAALHQHEQDLESNRIQEEAETAGALLQAERAAYRALEHEYTCILSGWKFTVHSGWRLCCVVAKMSPAAPVRCLR